MKSHPAFLSLVNTAEPRQAHCLGLANAFELDEQGWALIPFGDTLHSGRDARSTAQLANAPIEDRELAERAKKGVIQRFTRKRAEQMVADFRSLAGRFKRAVVGMNIFKGHPDAPAYAHIFKDKEPRGTIADMEVTDQGLRFKPVLTEQGAADVDSGWNQHSPRWDVVDVGDDPATGKPIVEAFKFISLGLVPKGNMPGLSLVNTGGELLPAPGSTSESMNKKLLELLAAMGINIAADADANAQESAFARAAGIFSAANTAATELVTVKPKVAALEGEKLQLVNTAATLTTERDTARTQLATERKARALLLVNGAILEGRLPAADKDTRILALCNAADFDTEAAALAALQKQLKTSSTLAELSTAGRNVQDRQGKVLALVNTAMLLPEVTQLPIEQQYDAAFAKVQGDPANAGLFAAMKQPAKTS